MARLAEAYSGYCDVVLAGSESLCGQERLNTIYEWYFGASVERP